MTNAMHKKREQGFSLMEVLVTVVILSIGLLGLAGLQAKSQQFTQSSYLRSQAAVLANDIMDRMRANRTAALISPTSGYAIDMSGDAPSSPSNCHTGACDTDDMAEFDKAQWLNTIANTLPSGDGEVATTPLPGGTGYLFQVSIQWDDPRTVEDPDAEGSEARPPEIFIFRGEL
jgi:type IV pilus assembly protein PilV